MFLKFEDYVGTEETQIISELILLYRNVCGI
jgi:hypothetical protein